LKSVPSIYNNVGKEVILPSTDPSCYITLQDGWNNEVFSSLTVYNANTDDHFSVSNQANDNSNILKTRLWAAYGDDQSQARFEMIGLKSAK
jgi:hypothetical protein